MQYETDFEFATDDDDELGWHGDIIRPLHQAGAEDEAEDEEEGEEGNHGTGEEDIDEMQEDPEAEQVDGDGEEGDHRRPSKRQRSAVNQSLSEDHFINTNAQQTGESDGRRRDWEDGPEAVAESGLSALAISLGIGSHISTSSLLLRQ